MRRTNVVAWGACPACRHALSRHVVAFEVERELMRCEIVGADRPLLVRLGARTERSYTMLVGICHPSKEPGETGGRLVREAVARQVPDDEQFVAVPCPYQGADHQESENRKPPPSAADIPAGP